MLIGGSYPSKVLVPVTNPPFKLQEIGIVSYIVAPEVAAIVGEAARIVTEATSTALLAGSVATMADSEGSSRGTSLPLRW